MSQNFRQTDQLLRAIADAQSIADRAEINRLVTAYVQFVEPCLQAPPSKARASTPRPNDAGSQWLEGAVVVVAISLLLGIGVLALYLMQPSDGPHVGVSPVVPAPPFSPAASMRPADARVATPNGPESAPSLGMPRSDGRTNAAVLAPPRQRRRTSAQHLRAPAHTDAETLRHPPRLEISEACKQRPLADNCAQ